MKNKLTDLNGEVGNNKYNVTVSNATGDSIVVDVYDVIDGFKVACPALHHLVKKALNAGVRGHKDKMQDLVDIRDSAHRAMQLEKNRINTLNKEK